MTTGKPKDTRPVLRFRHSELVLGPKVWAGCVMAALLIGLGVWVTPANGWAGVGIGVAGVLGALLGALFQTTPRERDFTANGASAVRGLLVIAEEVENAQLLATQLSQAANPKNGRVSLGLVDVQDRLQAVRVALYTSMAEWNSVAPGSLDEVNRLRGEGQKAFALLAKQAEENG
ncbi:hypothetical protein [Microbacterium sp. zg.Y909]|uniref:hypothetical protein n=1 Tax=Microbacterium sp. zg.Y909 TaxID=2969413 RepID=UPI00214CA50C|nr:hypothetical protein [Microbacterium sp. zg.Y909]MCR2824316.1 hypothetical protein [Microbacterium sp. zg.Y909]